MKIEIVVTRHPGLVEYLREKGLVAESVRVIPHATPAEVSGKVVCGVLPHSLSCLCSSFWEVPLNLPPELRGKELSLEQVRQHAGKMVGYKVSQI